VDYIMNVVDTYQFDGVDLDWRSFDPATSGDALRLLAADLRARLGARTLSASAIVTHHAYWGTVQQHFDRIGLMTYDLTGSWNPYSWHNSALYDPDGMVWSVDMAVRRFTAAGIPAGKLSVGIPFFGYRWTGSITAPQQYWSATPAVQPLNYQDFASSINGQNYRQDLLARVPYLATDNPGDTADVFLTYDDVWSIQEKIRYVNTQGLGGWMIWELSGDYLPSQSPRQPLLAAIRDLREPKDTTRPTVTISQSRDQRDPTGRSPIRFMVVFSEPVTGFTAADVRIGGSAAGRKVAAVSGGGTTYEVSISGMTRTGTVTLSILAGAAADAAGNTNETPVNADNVVTFRKGLWY
jgi:GH18 family chitinase